MTSRPHTVADLARRYGVGPGAVHHAIERAEQHADPEHRPPEPVEVDPATGRRYYDPELFDVFWQARPGRGNRR